MLALLRFSPLLRLALGLLSLLAAPAAHPAPAPDPEQLRLLNTDPNELRRLEALHRLEHSGSLQPNLLMRCITDISPKVRAEALRVAAPLSQKDPELELRLFALEHDPSPEVSLQLLPFLASHSNPKARPLFLRIAQRQADNPKAWALSLPHWGEDLVEALRTLAGSEFSKKNATERSRFLTLAANHAREHLSRKSVETLLSIVANADHFQKSARIALLRGLLGQVDDLPTQLAPRNKTISFESIPEPILQMMRSREKELLKILHSPAPALQWPEPN